MKFIKKFNEISMEDLPRVGGKNASLGTMISQLSAQNIRVPDGFAITASAYWHYLQINGLEDRIKDLVDGIRDTVLVKDVGAQVRALISQAVVPDDLKQEILVAYTQLSDHYGVKDLAVAIRSSATAEDLPTASFAGQQESFLNVCGAEAVLKNYQNCLASLFTERAIIYRIEQGFDHLKVALSVGIQKMVRSDMASAGVSFSLDPETGFKDVIVINASYGLGEPLVKGMVDPDEYVVHKPTLAQGYSPIIRKYCGSKAIKMVYAPSGESTVLCDVPVDDRVRCAISDDRILEIARVTAQIEDYYSRYAGQWRPMDVEWAIDGIDGMLYVVQARPETVHAPAAGKQFVHYVITGMSDDALASQVVATGQSIGMSIVHGVVRVVEKVADAGEIVSGEILVTRVTDPNWVPAMQRAAGIITEHGGRTCHAAIVSRELGIPAIVGVADATKILHTGQQVTLDCSKGKKGYVYAGAMPFQALPSIAPHETVTLPVPINVNIADPDRALVVAQLPVAGVGLARLEFIIANMIKIHPLAVLHPEMVTDAHVAQLIAQHTVSQPDKIAFFIDTLAEGIGMIAAAFYPRKVIVRLSDFKTNEYRSLLGGQFFEPEEENPMLGFRGASRYCHPLYREAFALECAALKKVREKMGLCNVVIMVPFVRTLTEADAVVASLASNGLVRGENGLALYMMVEVPSNVILLEDFAQRFDGFSIGSNDLTQLTLGIDRDSPLLGSLFDERDAAVKKMVVRAIHDAHKVHKPIGICGQAPSDYPEFADFLIEQGIDSISLNADAVVPFLVRMGKK